MSAVAIRDLHVAMSNLQLEAKNPARTRNDAQMGIKELQVLQLVDDIAPADAAELQKHIAEKYFNPSPTGDQLRLPQLTNFDGHAVRAAVSRVLSADIDAPGGTVEARAAESNMFRILAALEDATSQISRQAGFSQRG
jgi:hypothetical protein